MKKKIIRRIKYCIATLLYFLPDSIMLRLQYGIIHKRRLHLNHPVRFSEKIQYYKAYYHNPKMLECTDKYLVRKYVESVLGTDKYLNTLYQICDSAQDIDFNSLPGQFVIKTTDGGNGDNVFICKDKSKIDIEQVKKEINSWRNKRYYIISREWAYKGAKQSRVIIEKFLSDPQNEDGALDDYKFLCYDGKFKFLWVDKGRFTAHKRGFWDEKLNFLENISSDHPTFATAIELPANINEMIDIAEKLSAGFPFARIDLYNIKGAIIFGEITFYPWSGYARFTPDEFDFELGKPFHLNKETL